MNASLYLRSVFQELGLSSLFLGHASVCAILAFFTFLFVPETRGKTLTELCSIYEWHSWAIWWYFQKWPALFHRCDMHKIQRMKLAKYIWDNFLWQFLWKFLMTFLDGNFWWQFLMAVFDDNFDGNFWWQFLMTIFYDYFDFEDYF